MLSICWSCLGNTLRFLACNYTENCFLFAYILYPWSIDRKTWSPSRRLQPSLLKSKTFWMGRYTSLSQSSLLARCTNRHRAYQEKREEESEQTAPSLVMKTQICAWLTCAEIKVISSLERVRNSAKSIDKFGIAKLYLARPVKIRPGGDGAQKRPR